MQEDVKASVLISMTKDVLKDHLVLNANRELIGKKLINEERVNRLVAESVEKNDIKEAKKKCNVHVAPDTSRTTISRIVKSVTECSVWHTARPTTATLATGSCENNVPLDLGPWLDHNHTPLLAKNTSWLHRPSPPICNADAAFPLRAPLPPICKADRIPGPHGNFFVVLAGCHAVFSALHIWGEGGRRLPTLAINIATWGGRARKFGGTLFSHEPDPMPRCVSSIYHRIRKKHQGNHRGNNRDNHGGNHQDNRRANHRVGSPAGSTIGHTIGATVGQPDNHRDTRGTNVGAVRQTWGPPWGQPSGQSSA